MQGRKGKGKLFVISAPSGSGKTTLSRKLLSDLGSSKLICSISATTRKPRAGERADKDYFFISRKEFFKRKKAHQFLEWAKVLDSFYGTPGKFVQERLNRGENALLSIDVQGARKIKRKVKDAVFIFILPPSFRELESRLKRRSTEGKRQIAQRLRLARREMAHVKEYDYVILNDRLKKALAQLKEIIKLEGRK